MNVAIDFGNTFIKAGLFDGEELKDRVVFRDQEELKTFLQNFSGEALIISSVSGDPEVVASWAKGFEKVFIVSAKLPIPITNQYATPETLGVDRLAAVCGAASLYPGKACLVIDAGTCLKFELLDENAVYHGGAISPGVTMRFRAMNAFTARLPLVDPIIDPPLIGDSTTTCMQSGVINGMVAEIQGIVARYKERFPDLHVILTGGDAHFFENKLKGSIFAGPELVLRGLNSILLHNVIS